MEKKFQAGRNREFLKIAGKLGVDRGEYQGLDNKEQWKRNTDAGCRSMERI